MPFSRDRHSLFDFDCGQNRINELVHEIGDFAEIYPNSNELVSVVTQGTPRDTVQGVVACASGQVVTFDPITNVRCAPRIDIALVAVHLDFQNLGLSTTVTLDLVERLYRAANARDVELRMKEVVSLKSMKMWERAGFQHAPRGKCDYPDMRMRLNPSSLAMLRQRWQPRLRPGYELLRVPTTLQLG